MRKNIVYYAIMVLFIIGAYFSILYNLHSFPALFASIGNLFLAYFVYSRNERNSVNKSFAILSSAFAIFSMDHYGLYVAPSLSFAVLWSRVFRIGLIFIPSAFLNFALNLTKDNNVKSKRILKLSYTISAIFTIFHWFGYFEKGFSQTLWKYYPKGGVVYFVFVAYLVVVGILILVYLWKKSKNRISNLEHNQIQYVFLAGFAVLFFGLINTLASFGIKSYPLGSLGYVAFAGIIAYAIVRHELMDIKVIIKKSIIYGTLTTCIVSIYILTVGLLYGIFGITQFAQGSLIANAIVGVIIAAVFMPLRDRIQLIVDKLFFREKYNYKQILIDFSNDLTSIVELDSLLNAVLTKITEAMHIDRGYIMLLDEEKKTFSIKITLGTGINSPADFEIEEASRDLSGLKEKKKALLVNEFDLPFFDGLKKRGIDLCVPFITKDRLIGILCLGNKLSEDTYTGEDMSLLTTVANQAAIAIENALLSVKMIEVEKNLHQMDKLSALGTFASGMAHEIKNPLSSIKTFCSLAVNRFNDPKFVEKFTMIVPGEIERLQGILDQLLHFGKASPTDYKSVQIESVIDELLSLVSYETFKNNVRVIKHYGGNVPAINGAREQLKQVFMNLVLNAVQAMPGGGEIHITTGVETEGDDSGKVIVSFKDTGPGIPKENMAKLFKPFFTTKEKGTGLGLSIIHRIIGEHGGKIKVQSEINKGTAFTIYMPVA